MNLFAPPTITDINERRGERIKNCKRHHWQLGGMTQGRFPIKDIEIAVTIPKLLDLDFTNYKVCSKCGLVENGEPIRSTN